MDQIKLLDNKNLPNNSYDIIIRNAIYNCLVNFGICKEFIYDEIPTNIIIKEGLYYAFVLDTLLARNSKVKLIIWTKNGISNNIVKIVERNRKIYLKINGKSFRKSSELLTDKYLFTQKENQRNGGFDSFNKKYQMG